MNIVQIISEETVALRDKPALIAGRLTLSYGELMNRVEELRQRLVQEGTLAGERVALVAEDSIDYVLAALAILAAGAVVVPVAPVLSREETDQVLGEMKVHRVLSENKLNGENRGISFGADIFVSSSFSLVDLSNHGAMPADYEKLDAAFIRFSSGTTGTSKGVLLSHRAIVDRTDAANEGLHMNAEDTVLWVLSMSFHFVVTILLFLRKGSTIVLCNYDFPLSLAEGLTRHHATFLYASPFHYHVLSSSSGFKPDALSNIRMAVSTAMHLPEESARLFESKFGLPLSAAYGIIEVGLPFISRPGKGNRIGSVGPALPGYEVDIRDPDAEGIGEVLLRGKGMFDAYLSPWRLRNEALEDGWFQTGDLGVLDKDGYLFIKGRKNAVINFSGMKIFPEEIEDVLNQHPAIDESLVYAQPHPLYGHLPQAKVLIGPAVDKIPDARELRRYCFERLAPYKVPKSFEFVDTLEKTATHKLKRK